MNPNSKHITENEQSHIDNLYEAGKRELEKIEREKNLHTIRNKLDNLSILMGKEIIPTQTNI